MSISTFPAVADAAATTRLRGGTAAAIDAASSSSRGHRDLMSQTVYPGLALGKTFARQQGKGHPGHKPGTSPSKADVGVLNAKGERLPILELMDTPFSAATDAGGTTYALDAATSSPHGNRHLVECEGPSISLYVAPQSGFNQAVSWTLTNECTDEILHQGGKVNPAEQYCVPYGQIKFELSQDENSNNIIKTEYYGAIQAETAFGEKTVVRMFPIEPCLANTMSPTKVPTASPTTMSPTKVPTASPMTMSPTKNPTASPTKSSPWEIQFEFMSVDFNASAPATDEDLLLIYEVGQGKKRASSLYAGPCNSNKTMMPPIKPTGVVTEKDDSITKSANTLMSTLELRYDVDISLITASNIWNDTTSQIQLCQVLQLVEEHSHMAEDLVIAEDIRDVTIGINSFLNFSLGFDLVGATINAVNKTTSLSSFISAYICTGDDTMERAVNAFELGPNEKLHVCFMSQSTDVEISNVTSMVINGTDLSGGAKELTVLAGGVPSIQSITSLRYVNTTSAVCTTRVPINMFDYERADATITIKGSLAMNLQGDAKKRQLWIEDQVSTRNRGLQQLDNVVGEEVQFGISVDLKRSDISKEEHISLLNSASKILTSIGSLVVVAYVIW